MTGQERAKRLKEAIAELEGAVSAFEHGRKATALDKLDAAHDIIEDVDYDCHNREYN